MHLLAATPRAPARERKIDRFGAGLAKTDNYLRFPDLVIENEQAKFKHLSKFLDRPPSDKPIEGELLDRSLG